MKKIATIKLGTLNIVVLTSDDAKAHNGSVLPLTVSWASSLVFQFKPPN